MTKSCGLIGYPIKHSAGRSILQAAFDHLNLDIRCEEWEIDDPARLESLVNYIRREEVLGANVTIPYKESLVPFMDELDETTRMMGAITTIAKRNGKLIGYNTDSMGFMQALTTEGGFEPKGKQVVILGAGGVARGCSFILATSGVSSIMIVNRTLSRAHALASELKQICSDVQVMDYEDIRLKEAIGNSALLVNCTSFGMKWSALEGKSPIREGLIPKGQLVFDVVYKPLETPLLKMAKEAGAKVLGGLSMVVYVCAVSLRLMLDKEPPLEIMFEAARKAAEQYT